VKIFEKSNGAVIFPGEKYDLHNRVFINSIGLPTYEAKELGLAKIKDRDFVYDQSIVITGNEVNDYFKVLLKAIELLDPQISKKTTHVGHGMLRLPEGKMSSRTGKVLTGETLIEEVMVRWACSTIRNCVEIRR
jgi:arginyl-tRNA synthetase